MKDLIIPFAVLASIASIILPLPSALLDVLIVSNLMLALMLLISALNLSDPTKFSGLPTLLLLATLYRLALNVSTTRSILSHGDGGQTVEAFGSIVIQGNLVVGFVVFILITIIQFIVIAKGSERVAEVAARFTLDALPGKQMSIDAELRAGMLDPNTAKTKRQELQIESRFYGALDGAMKFVKGDAIAGMLITIVNVIGGLAVGIFIEGMDMSRALHHYTTLSVGDGLVSQIPALLNALAAGIVVTRVNRGDHQTLSSDLLNQLGQYRLVTGLVAFVSLGLACFPGLPSIPFVGIGIVLGLVTLLKKTVGEAQVIRPTVKAFAPALPELLSISYNHEKLTQEILLDIAEELRKALYATRGIVLPQIPLLADESIPAKTILISLRGFMLASYTAEELSVEMVKNEFLPILTRQAIELIDDAHTRRLLGLHERRNPDLVAALVPQVVSVTQITEITRRLTEEAVPLNNFDLILQALAEHSGKSAYERQVVEEVRIAVRRSVLASIGPAVKEIDAVLLDPLTDYLICQKERAGKTLDIQEVIEVGAQVRGKLLAESSDNSEGANQRAVIASKGARRLMRESLMIQDIQVTVLALEEVHGLVAIKEKGRICLAVSNDPESVAQAEADTTEFTEEKRV